MRSLLALALLASGQVPTPEQVGSLTPSGLIQWLLVVVLFGVGGLITWATRSFVSRSAKSFDKLDSTIDHVAAAVSKQDALSV